MFKLFVGKDQGKEYSQKERKHSRRSRRENVPGYIINEDESLGGRRHWAMLVDEPTRCKHSFFLKNKSDQVEMVCSWLKGIKDTYKIQVEFIRCNNAGENMKLEEKCGAEGLGIIFEYKATGPLNMGRMPNMPSICKHLVRFV